MRLILIRHGQTLFNMLNKVQGWCDSPLTKLGIQQANKAKEIIQNEIIDHAFSSTSERAYDTAVIALGNRDLKIIKDKRLKEMNFGVFEGSANEYKNHFCRVIHQGEEDFRDYRGESETQMKERFNSCIDELYIKYPNDTVLIASHGLVLTRFIQQHCQEEVKQLTGERFFCKNAAVSILERDENGYHIICLNKED